MSAPPSDDPGNATGANDARYCPCGSGLRVVRCCELDWSNVDAPATGDLPDPRLEQAAEARLRGDRRLASQLVLAALDIAPACDSALWILHDLLAAEGRLVAAEALLRRLLRLKPSDFSVIHALCLLLLRKGQPVEALSQARNAIRLAPIDPKSHNLMGMALTEAQRPQFGEHHYRRAIELSGERAPIMLSNLAWNLMNQGRIHEARALFEEADRSQPNMPEILLNWAKLEEVDRQFDAAEGLLDRLDEIVPSSPTIMLARAIILGRREDHDGALKQLDAIAAGREAGALGPAELLQQGRLLDELGHFDAAFAAFALGKRKLRELSGRQYLSAQAEETASRLKGFFTAERLAILPQVSRSAASPQPIFILGFPRSGTTLLEQSLSAHRRISAGDELPTINEIAALAPRMLGSPLAYPEALSELWMADQREGLDNLRDYYLQRLRQLAPAEAGAAWITDKMPLNETHLGLIALLFPKTPLIYVRRHPLDVVLSVYANVMTHGLYMAYDLESIARHYVLVSDLVELYRREMPLNCIDVRYEDIVGNQEETLRRVLDFVGEPFDRACIDFTSNPRYARTASYAQVTQPLYARSRYRHRHYLKQLAPVLPILASVIERLGYSVSSAI